VVAGDTILIASRPQYLAAQHGYARNLTIKLAINGAAVAATAGTWLLGRRLDAAGEVPVEGPPSPARTPRRRRPVPSAGCGSCNGRSRP
jgi:hypothetical protein